MRGRAKARPFQEEDKNMKWIIKMNITDDQGNNVDLYEEFTNRQDFDRRYCELAMNYDESIHWAEIK